MMSQSEIDTKNTEFWDELCGSGLARSLGISQASSEGLRRFDEAYMGLYPYLEKYVVEEALGGKRVLEIGPGFGTLGHLLASRGCEYYGLDIAKNSVAMMRYRLSLLGQDPAERIQQGSALEIPHKDSSFDYVYSVGCLHHTGNLGQAISEVYRVLASGGKAIVMLYHKYSFQRLVKVPLLMLRGLLKDWAVPDRSRKVRALYDTNAKGEAAPHTDYVSRSEVRDLFKRFARVHIESQNFDNLAFLKGRLVIPREKLLSNLARVAGLDLYIQAYK